MDGLVINQGLAENENIAANSLQALQHQRNLRCAVKSLINEQIKVVNKRTPPPHCCRNEQQRAKSHTSENLLEINAAQPIMLTLGPLIMNHSNRAI